MASGARRAYQAVSFSDFEFGVILGAQLTELSDSALEAEMMRAPLPQIAPQLQGLLW